MIKIKNGGIIEVYNDETDQWIENLNPPEIIDEAYEIYEIEEGTTVGDIFNFIDNNLEFFKEFLPYNIDDLLSDISKEPTDATDIRYINLNWEVEEFDGYIDEQISVIGWGDCHSGTPEEIKDLTMRDENGNTSYVIGFTPLSRIKNVTIEINDDYVVYSGGFGKGSYLPMFKSKKRFTLMDLIDGLLSELTINGTAAERDGLNEEILDVMNKMENGEIDSYSIQEIEHNIEEQELKVLNQTIQKSKNNTKAKKTASKDNIIDEIDSIIDDLGR